MKPITIHSKGPLIYKRGITSIAELYMVPGGVWHGIGLPPVIMGPYHKGPLLPENQAATTGYSALSWSSNAIGKHHNTVYPHISGIGATLEAIHCMDESQAHGCCIANILAGCTGNGH